MNVWYVPQELCFLAGLEGVYSRFDASGPLWSWEAEGVRVEMEPLSKEQLQHFDVNYEEASERYLAPVANRWLTERNRTLDG